MSEPKTIVLCSSANFYKHVNEIADELKKMGYKTLVPETAAKMRVSGNYDAQEHRSWYRDPKDFAIKSRLMRGHFDKVAKGDAILVVNDEKKGTKGYIGANALMEMGLAFFLRKPIYILDEVSQDMPIYEEVMGMQAVILNGNLGKIEL
jgi:diphthamide synthase subunit DPH2